LLIWQTSGPATDGDDIGMSFMPVLRGNRASHEAPIVLTWNCKHLANAAIRKQIEKACNSAGHDAPIICTPDELMEE
jgi:hypothetical protein